jgi:imidazolonepropionase-like amidohydrolase
MKLLRRFALALHDLVSRTLAASKLAALPFDAHSLDTRTPDKRTPDARRPNARTRDARTFGASKLGARTLRASAPAAFAVALAVVAAAAAGAQLPPPPAAAVAAPEVVVHAFIDVCVVPMDSERVLEHQTVIVRGARIESIQPQATARVPDGAVRIDGRGKWLMPGLAEMHGHVPPPNFPADVTASYLELYVLRGATTVRTMYGFPNQFELRDRIRAGELLGPTLYTAAPALHGNAVNGAEQARELVRKYAADGYDLLKIHEGLTREEYDAIVDEAAKLKLRTAGHVPDEVGIRRALEAGQGIDHLDSYWEEAGADDDKLRELARISRERRTWIVATQDLWRSLYGADPVAALEARAELRYVHPKERAQWLAMKQGQLERGDAAEGARMLGARDRMLGFLAREDAHLLLGSDAPQVYSVPGFSLEHELPAMERAGVSRWQILVAGTRAPAEYWGATDEFGTVQPGRRADLLLLEGNPLADIAAVHRQAGVMVLGRWLDKAEIEQRLHAIAETMASAVKK